MARELSKSVALRLAEAAARPETVSDLEVIARERLADGETREGLLLICQDARTLCETERAEDNILDLMDRLTGWSHPRYRL